MPSKHINDTTDYALLFQTGDEKGLSFFYHEFYPALVHFSLQITQSRCLSEELASEAFVKTWRMHFKLDSYAGIKAYLYKVVHRDSMAAGKQEQKRKVKSFQESIAVDTPFDLVLRSEVFRLVHAALRDVAPASRKVMLMHYLEGKTTGEISRELNLHPSTIKTQKTQGLKALKKVFLKSVHSLLSFCIIFL